MHLSMAAFPTVFLLMDHGNSYSKEKKSEAHLKSLGFYQRPILHEKSNEKMQRDFWNMPHPMLFKCLDKPPQMI